VQLDVTGGVGLKIAGAGPRGKLNQALAVLAKILAVKAM
jgi:hypothetical protein